ncbi:MAG: transketolase C-terminal domain-containing protein [bacterium]
MRSAFINSLLKKADENTFLMVGDLGYSVIEQYVGQRPEQFLNAGIAEQNMTGMAAGMAMEGFKVFTYSIANFNTIRCLEQIRNDICYHNLDVTIVSVGGGLTYGSAGYSHHAVQDIALLGSLPNMTLLLPGDPVEVEYCMEYIFNKKGPKYLRIGKNGEPRIHENVRDISNITKIKSTNDNKRALITTSNTLHKAIEVCELLLKDGIAVDLFSVSVIDRNFGKELNRQLSKYQKIFTIEEHIDEFGFGSLVKSRLEGINIQSFGLKKDLCKVVGSQSYLCGEHGLTTNNIKKEIFELVRKNK